MMPNTLCIFAVAATLVTGCGTSSPPRPNDLPYDTDRTTVIGGGQFFNPGEPSGTDRGVLVGTPNGDECIELDDACVQPQGSCGDDGVADVLVDAKGTVLSVVCYPTTGVSIVPVAGPVDHVGNNAVLVVDADGPDIAGDVTLDGNNVTLYGAGPDVSLIDGNLHLAKNNTLVRGVRIAGDVVIDKNNGSLIDCVIEGDLTISGNNVNIALCEIWGTLTISGNNTVLVSNAFASAPHIDGKPKGCNDNVLFRDANADGSIVTSEIVGPYLCN